MSDLEQLFWVLAALTLAFGTVWVRPGGTLLVSQAGEPHRLVWAARRSLLHNDHGGLLLGNLLPTGSAVVAAPWPLTVSPSGVVALAASATTPDGRAPTSGRFVAFAALRSVSTDGAALLVNGEPFVTAVSKTAAVRWAGWLDELRALPETDRGAWIERALAAHCDAAAAGEVVRACRRQTRWVRAVSTLLFAYCFGALGAAAFTDLPVPLRAAVPGYFALVAATFLALRAAAGRTDGHGWMVLVSPVDAFRAADLLTRPRLEVFHPLALGHVLATRAAHEAFARRVALDLAHPLPPPPLSPDAAAAAAWFAGRLRDAVGAAFRASGFDPAALAAPPAPDDRHSLGYCPRCHGQYTRAGGECPACGISLRSFAPQTG